MKNYNSIANEILKELKALEGYKDLETSHEIADSLLCKLLLAYGHSDIVKAFRSIDKWYA